MRFWDYLLPRRVRAWSFNSKVKWSKRLGYYTTMRRSWLARLISKGAFAVADRYNRDPNRCWASLALWAMGEECYRLDSQITPDCGWCGKCPPKEKP